MRRALAGGIAAVALAAAAPANASTTEVGANGNVFTGGLSFTPATVTIAVGDTVRWRNTDNVVPHTATEDHELWDLTGDYGATPANPPGFGPGETRQRVFEAGTHTYFCRVHPTQMRGTIAVPPKLAIQRVRVRVKRKRHRRRRTKLITYVVATWAGGTPGPGLAFDVQRARYGGGWVELATGTRAPSTRFRIARGSTWVVRARLRRAADRFKGTDWSPAAGING